MKNWYTKAMNQKLDFKHLKYIGYLRKSSDEKDRQILSKESQKDEIKAKFPDLDIEWVEEDKSAFEPHSREGFATVLRRIEIGEKHGIVAWHPDRLSRNEKDGADVTFLFRKQVMKDLKFCEYRLEHTPSTAPDPDVIKNLQTALSDAQHSSAKLGKDVKRGLRAKRKMGWRPNQAALGYLNDPHGLKGEKKIFVDESRFPLVRQMWDLLLSGGHTPAKIRRIANEDLELRTKRGHKLSNSVIYKLFTNIFYTGYFYDENGELIKGSHTPMITMAEFERAQILLGSKGKPAPHTYEHAYTGPMHCGECGCQITAQYKRHCTCTECGTKFSCRQQTQCPECETDISEMANPIIWEGLSYGCTKKRGKCGQATINVIALEKQLDHYLGTLQLNERYLRWALKYLQQSHQSESVTQERILESQQRAFKQGSQRLNKLLELRMADELTAEEYQIAKNKELEQQALRKARLDQTEKRQHQWLELSERTFNFAAYARYWLADADREGNLQKKREILTTLGSNLILTDKILHIDAPEPFKILKEALAAIPEARATENARFEPRKTPVFADERAAEAQLDSVVPEWSG